MVSTYRSQGGRVLIAHPDEKNAVGVPVHPSGWKAVNRHVRKRDKRKVQARVGCFFVFLQSCVFSRSA